MEIQKLKSIMGYRDDSPFKKEPFIDILSSEISMNNVSQDLILIPNKGKPVIAKAGSGGYLFPNASKVTEVPLYQAGGVSMKPVSPFMDLKMFKNRYKLEQLPTYQEGGILDNYIRTLPEEQQNLFMGEFQSLEPDVQQEVIKYMMGGKYQEGGNIQRVGSIEFDSNKSKDSGRGYLVVNDLKTKKDFGVQRNPDGSYRFYDSQNPNQIEKDYITNWFDSPISKKRYELSGGIGGYSDELDFEDATNTAQNSIIFNVDQTKEILSKVKDKKIATQRLNDIRNNKISGVNLLGKKGKSIIITNNNLDGVTILHELSHNKYIDSNAGQYIRDHFPMNNSEMSKYLKKNYREIHPRLMEIRFQLGLKPGQKVNNIPDEVIKKSQLDTVYDKDVLIDILNSVVTNDNTHDIDYAQTGGMSSNLAEVEGNETAVTPDSELVEFKGKKHKDGGIKVDLPNGTRIYSEYTKAPSEIVEQVLGKKNKGKMSYADLSKRFPTLPYLEILSDEKSDEYERNGAQLKLMNNLSKLDTIFYAQEAEKKSSGDKFQMGGKFQPGGEVQPQIPPTPLTYYIPPIKGQGEQEFLLQMPDIQNPIAPNYEFDITNKRKQNIPQVRSKQSNKRTKPVLDLTGADSDLLEIPLPFGQLPMADNQVVSQGIQAPETAPILNQEDSQDYFFDENSQQVSEDDKDFPLRSKENRFGISSKLAGTIADIGLALSDKLRVSEPTLYDRRKYPLFTRFVDFDDKEVQRMYDKGIQQIQNSNLPEAQKQAQISELLSKYQDYQGKVDYNNLQRYENKREGDTNKLQSYLDQNTDIKVADTQDYKERKSRVDYLRDQFLAQRKSRVVNSLKAYADYADKINMANQLYTENYTINPITGRINYKPNQKSDLTQDLLEQYSRNAQNKVNLGNGLTGVRVGNKLIVTNADGTKFEAVNIE